MDQDIHQEFERILKKKKVASAYSFFKELPPEQRRELMPTLKKLSKYYYEYLNMGNTWGTRGTSEQILILNIAIFVCATGKEYERIGSVWLESNIVKNIFEFYIPDWLGNYINIQSSKEGFVPFRMDYKWMMQLKNKGLMEPANHLIIKLLPEFLYDSKQIKNSYQRIYTRNDSKLLIYPETLKEHIWLFFKEESNIHWTDHYMNNDAIKKELLSWKQAFKYFADNGTIDRLKLLRSSLSVANMNFNKSSSGWFIDLFDMLEPTQAEMLKLQDDMMGVFNSPHSKSSNIVLKHIKKLCLEKGFSTNTFLTNTPILLSSETKSIVTSTLMVLDKLAKKHPRKSNEICISATQALVSNDSAIQTRAAKLIAKYGKENNEDLSNEIEAYRDVLLTESSGILSNFIAEKDNIDDVVIKLDQNQDTTVIVSDENRIQIPDNIDDLMFMASQVFDHNDDLHFDIFPAALINLNNKITDANVDRFEPALQRAYKHVMGDWRSGIGILDHMLSVFFIEYTNILIDRFPKGAVKLKKIQDTFHKKEKDNKRQFRSYQRHLYTFKEWFGTSDSPIYKPFFEKLMFVLKQIRIETSLPLLSTPTHYPYWIDPEILIHRVKLWQDSNNPLGHIDFQFAMSRTYLKNAQDLIPKIKEVIIDEPQRLLSFLLKKDATPESPYKTIAHWWTASITKSPETIYYEFNKFIYAHKARALYTGDYSWRVGNHAFSNSKWDYKKGKSVNFTDYRKMLTINLNPKKKEKKLFGNFFSVHTSPKIGESTMLYKELFFKGQWYETNEFDVKRFYSLVPNNPENLLAKICDRTLKHPEFFGETAKRMFIFTLEQLLEQRIYFGNMAHLLVAGGLICSDKTAKALAGEVWVYAVSNDLIDNAKIGSCIGAHYAAEFAPLKRFTDLIIEGITRVSNKHDVQLQVMIENILTLMNETPMRGLKKILEIYQELLRKNNKNALPELENKFKNWASSKSLSKIIKLLNVDF